MDLHISFCVNEDLKRNDTLWQEATGTPDLDFETILSIKGTGILGEISDFNWKKEIDEMSESQCQNGRKC